MATQTIQRQTTIAVPENRSDRWEGVKDFFGGLADYFSLFFNSGASIEILDDRKRSQLSVEERARIDLDMYR